MSDNLVDLRLRDLLDKFASADPTPGGGSASALAGAVGAALLTMVASLPRTRHNAPAERELLGRAAGALLRHREELAALIDRDTDAYRAVLAAYRRPKGSEEEYREREAAIQEALGGAIETPLGMMRAATAALEQGRIVAEHGNPAASSDVKVAVMLLREAVAGARSNVEINLQRLTDSRLAASAQAEAAELEASAETSAVATRQLLAGR